MHLWTLWTCGLCGPVDSVDLWTLWTLWTCGLCGLCGLCEPVDSVDSVDLWTLWTLWTCGPVDSVDLWTLELSNSTTAMINSTNFILISIVRCQEPELTSFETTLLIGLACVASVSVWFRVKERGTRVRDRAKNGASKRAGNGWDFLALVSFLGRPKPKVPFVGLSSLRNQTETLATQDTINLDPRTLYRVQPSFNPHLLSCSLFYNTTLLSKQRTVTSIFCCLENATMIHCYCSVNCLAGVYTKGCLFFTITNQYGLTYLEC